MLQSLSVENFALIDNVTVEFGGGLNILTGETGAGKSILIDALGMVLGNRVGVGKIRKGSDKLRVAAKFSDGLTIERIVSRTSSTVTVNGKPTTLSALKKFSASRVDIHGQNKNLALLNDANVYALIDDEKISAKLTDFRRLFKSLTAQRRALAEKISAREENLRRLEFLRWQEQEISAAHLKPDEDDEIDAQIKKLSHAEKIAEDVQHAAQILNDGDDDILTGLARVSKYLADVARFDDKLNAARKLLDEAEIFLHEAADDIHAYADGMDFAPERLDELHARADEIFKLKQKYSASVNEILQRLTSIRAEISAAENFDADTAELQRSVAELKRSTETCAAQLLTMRRASAKILSAAVEREVRRLGMEGARFQIVVNESELTSRGADSAEIFFSANVGEELLPLSNVASGGELSRVALAIKTVTADDSSATMIFDEIDAGLGGVTAKTVAEAIKKISRRRQVLCVTHLAQIAAAADVHLRITKSEIGGRMVTAVERLNDTERVKEISRMASGKESATSLSNAREMIASAHR